MILSNIISLFCVGTSTLFGYKLLYVPTQSMEPTIAANQIIIAKYISDPAEIKEGDIVAYIKNPDKHSSTTLLFYLLHGKGNNYLVVHRVLSITSRDTYLFKGDNNEFPDMKEVLPEQLQYKVIFY